MNKKIVTYHEEINFNKQQELVSLWSESWKRQGYDTIILSRNDAEQYFKFSEFVERMSALHKEIIGQDITEYGLSCYFRWMAYASKDFREPIFFSDYDVINKNFNRTPQDFNLHLMDGPCPCFGSGDSVGFNNLCEKFITVTEKRVEFLKSIKRKMSCYHDQEFFWRNICPSENKENEFFDIKFKMVRGENFEVAPFLPYEPNNEKFEAYHVSHHNVHELEKRGLYVGSPENSRIQIVKDIMSKSKS